MAEYVRCLTGSRTLASVAGILLPGQIEARIRAVRLREGLGIEEGVWGQLPELGRTHGVPLQYDVLR